MTTPTKKKMGRPKGKMQKTILKEEALRQYKQRAAEQAGRILTWQLGLAQGSQYLMMKRDGQDAVRITDPDEMEAYLNGEYTDKKGVFYFLTAKDPDTRAQDSILNRVFGRPTESLDISAGGEPIKTVKIIIETDSNED